jgi:uncharacterized protein YqiB (DUF1249 family)
LIKKKHTFDLSAQMAECEANYARIMQLLPDMDTVDQREFGVELPSGQSVLFRIDVIERCKYTTMVDIYQHVASSSISSDELPPWAVAPSFSLRIYHDARMAEVTAYDRQQAMRSSYDYPNAKMYQRDEKTQLNSFLGEWLKHCLKYGHGLEDLGDSAMCRVSN